MGLFLSQLTWEEAKVAFGRNCTVLIPVGSTEQHGPHLPLGTDWIIPNELSRLLTEKADVITIPGIPVGIAEHHMDFAGTLTMTPEHFKNCIMDICESLAQWGAKRFVFMNGHGGNTEALSQVALHLRKRYGALSAIVQWWEVVGEVDGIPAIGHGGLVESSVIASIDPKMVRFEKVDMRKPKTLSKTLKPVGISRISFKGIDIRTSLTSKDISNNGSMPDQLEPGERDSPAAATSNRGRVAVSRFVKIMTEFIEEFNLVKPLVASESFERSP